MVDMKKPGIKLTIPGFGDLDITTIVTDYTGTHSCGGKLSEGSEPRLQRLAELVDIIILTSDTFGTAKKELARVPHVFHLLDGTGHDVQKEAVVSEIGPSHVAAFGNGNNDRFMLAAVKRAGGLAVAVDNGEGCAYDAILAANLFIHGSPNALELLVNPLRLIATLRS